MAQVATLHVKIEPSTARNLKSLARHRGQTVGELVRRAISSCYQPDSDDLTDRQRQAVEAFRGGFISIGKLAGLMGLSVLEARAWVNEHGVSQQAAFSPKDIAHA